MFHTGAGAPVVRQRWVFTDLPWVHVPGGCVFMNRIWDADQVSRLTVGQLPLVESNYRQDARWRLPAGLAAGHMCHPEWLATGEPWPPTLPPTVYGPSWIPECCGLFQDLAEGGFEFGGECGDTFTTPDPTEGGMEMGGESGDTYRPPDPTEGGMEMGGESGDTYRPPDPTEGGMEMGGESGDEYTSTSGSWVRDVRGSYTFTASFTGDHLLRLYGGGGRGAISGSGGGMDLSGGGGGGGAEANSVLALMAGVDYDVTVGAGGDDVGADGGPTTFAILAVLTVVAPGGAGAVGTVGGAGGPAVGGLGDQVWSGGTGADGGAFTPGGGGGSSACYSASGIPPGTGTGGAGSAGGIPVLPDGGAGGDGASGAGLGAGGGYSGGGGGGNGPDSDPSSDPGAGHDGRIVIEWPA